MPSSEPDRIDAARQRRRRPTFPLPATAIPEHQGIASDLCIQQTDDGSRTLINMQTGVTYHSSSGAVTETRSVYLENSGIAETLRNGGRVNVLEIGLGTGLALLMALDQAHSFNATLNYVSVERDWLGGDILERLQYDRWLSEPTLFTGWVQWRRSLGDPVDDGVYGWTTLTQHDNRLNATVIHGDAASANWSPWERFDAVFLDPFAPNVNPELWRSDWLARLHQSLKPSGRLVTYCVSRQVREAMTAAGFRVHRKRGPQGGKREVMVATKSA